VRAIQTGSTNHGSVHLWTRGPRIPPETLVAMDHAATIAALTMTQAQAVAGREQRSRVLLLEELVSGHPLERADVLSRASAFGWDLTQPRAALRLELVRSGDSGQEEVLVAGQPLEDQLAAILRSVAGRGTIAWGLRSGMAALLEVRPGGQLEGPGAAFRAAIREAHPDLQVAIAIGRTYADVADLHRTYREAVETLLLGHQLHAGDFAVAYDDLVLYRLLSEVPAASLERHVTETLGPLIDFDRRHRGSLLETLEAYLSHQRNRAETARTLFIHYNTLRYRLEQVRRLLGDRAVAPDGWVTVELAVHARRLLAAQQGIAPDRSAPQASASPRASAVPEVRPKARRGSGSPRSSRA
jgi:purine catabolism regulator